MSKKTLFLFLSVLLLSHATFAQRTLEHDYSIVSQVRVDLRELGYPPVDVIPSEESAVRSLTVAPNGAIYGATSGKRSHLFVMFPVHGYVQPLCYLNGVTTIHRSIVVSKSGDLYIGSGDKDGHLYRYATKNDEHKPNRVDVACEVTDLGAPAAGEGIYSLAINRMFDTIYGLTWPNGQFFSFDIVSGKFTVHGKVAERKIPGEKFETNKNIGRAMMLDDAGRVFTSGEDGAIYRFHPASGLEKLGITASTVRGREPYNGVDAWAKDACGMLYGGTSDGYLFRLDPKTSAIENLGKPLNQYRIRGLVFARNGKLYGAGGDDDEMARLFSYDPSTGAYEMLGMIDVNRRPFYTWQAYVVDSMAIGDDDTIYIGQAERKSKLYLYYPEPAVTQVECEAP
jgi:outer membrane protein assembly factor BamB